MAYVKIDPEYQARSLQGAAVGAATAPLFPALPSGKASLSTIAPATRPEISQPKHIVLNVLGSHMENQRLAARSIEILFERPINEALKNVDQLNLEKQEPLENEARSAKSRATWSTLSIVSQYISSAGLIALGGPSCVAAGVIGIGNRILNDTHLLHAGVSWYTKSVELQKKITNTIETTASFLQMGLGLAGGFAIWQSGALSAAQINSRTIHQGIKSVISLATGVTSVVSKVGTGYHDKQIAYLRAQMREIDTQSTNEHLTIHTQTKEMGRMVEAAQSETDEMKKIIQALQISQD
jgi:hypothetical protein